MDVPSAEAPACAGMTMLSVRMAVLSAGMTWGLRGDDSAERGIV